MFAIFFQARQDIDNSCVGIIVPMQCTTGRHISFRLFGFLYNRHWELYFKYFDNFSETHPNITWYEQCVTYNFFANETQEVIYSLVGMILIYALPLVIIIYSYAAIYLEIFRRSRIQNSGILNFK
jgi:hypothetical protein